LSKAGNRRRQYDRNLEATREAAFIFILITVTLDMLALE